MYNDLQAALNLYKQIRCNLALKIPQRNREEAKILSNQAAYLLT